MSVKFGRHPLSSAFGDMSQDEFSALRKSCNKIGIQEAICLLDGLVLDGWHRYVIGEEDGLDYRTFNLSANLDPQDYVMARNHDRRSQTPTERAISVAAVYAWRPPGRPKADDAKTARDLAGIANVSQRTMERAKAVVAKGAPEVVEAVRNGAVSLDRAADVAINVPKRDQPIALIDPESSAAATTERAKNNPAGLAGLADDSATLLNRIKELEAKSESQSDEVSRLLESLSEAAEKTSEAAELLEELRAELESVNRVIEADEGADRIKAALAEAARFRTLYRSQEERLNSLMAEKGEAVKSAKYWQRQANGNAHKAKH